MKIFDKASIKELYQPDFNSSNEDNGQVTIIGGSKLFHGAPLFSLKVASRIVDMVFFASPEHSLKSVVSRLKADLSSFIWVPWEEVEEYVKKSDAVLIGPGFMRYASEHTTKDIQHRKKLDNAGERTKEITERLLKKFPNKRWVIDAGSLQVIDPEVIPEGSVLTPNKKEFELLFGERSITSDDGRMPARRSGGDSSELEEVKKAANRYKCVIVLKGPETIVCSPDKCTLVKGGNPGLTKGGTGDVLSGLTVALYAKNDPFLSAASASYIVKKAGDELYKKVGVNYNADDLTEKIPEVLKKLAK